MILPDNIVETGITLRDQVFDLRGLEAYSSLSVPTLRDYIKAGALPCFKIKGKILIRKSEFDTWLEGYRVNKQADIKAIADKAINQLRSA